MSSAPWDKDQIGSYVFGSFAGIRAHQNGAGVIDSVDIGLRWRFWYKAVGFGFILGTIAACTVPFRFQIPLYSERFVGSNGVPYEHWYTRTEYTTFGNIEAFVLLPLWWLLISGITAAKLIMYSGYRGRITMFVARLFWPITRHIPNVANFWLYLLFALPLWLHFILSDQGLFS
jgi:hypothetical protein